MSWASKDVSRRGHSWSTSSSIVTPKFPPPLCICKRPYVINISRTMKNPHRRFYGCPYFKVKKPHCGTFVWPDEHELKIEEERINEMEMGMGDGKIPQLVMDMGEMKAQMKEIQLKIEDIAYVQRSFGQ